MVPTAAKLKKDGSFYVPAKIKEDFADLFPEDSLVTAGKYIKHGFKAAVYQHDMMKIVFTPIKTSYQSSIDLDLLYLATDVINHHSKNDKVFVLDFGSDKTMTRNDMSSYMEASLAPTVYYVNLT